MELFESSPRLAARDGMEQEPYEFRSCPARIAKRSSSIPESKGKERAASRLSLKDARKNPHARLSWLQEKLASANGSQCNPQFAFRAAMRIRVFVVPVSH